MSNNMRMLIDNLWDTATLSVAAGTEVSSLPVANSQIYGRSKTAAITPDGAGNSQFTFELGSLQLIDGLVLYRHWLSDLATWRVELFDGTELTGTRVYDSDTVPAVATKTLGELNWLVDTLVVSVFGNWPFKFSQCWMPPTFARSGRITISDTDARDGLHEFDRVFLGRSFQPTFNFSYGHQHQWLSAEAQRVTAAQSVFSTARPRHRRVAFSLDYLSEQERPHMSEAIRSVGITKDFFISMFPETGGRNEIEYAMSAKFVGNPALSGNFFNNFTAPIEVREA
ncbi:hypothetical protein [Gilvimarinus agarilyticus]|uniref:hypothetical protein n=1 Tax=Gilvimarinus agarilyticus TaxID=679259 RepID=UPI0005A013AB|nr:hypothetical protein [Gilvimarinus agarilyticus]